MNIFTKIAAVSIIWAIVLLGIGQLHTMEVENKAAQASNEVIL